MIRGWDGQKLNALVDRTYGERAANATNLEKGTLSWFQMYHTLHIHCNVPNPSFFIVTSVIVLLRKNPSLSRIILASRLHMIHIVPSCVDQPVYSWRSGLLWLEYWKLFIGNTKTMDHFNFFRMTFSISFECTGGKHWGEDHFEIPSIHPTVLERGCQCQSCETIKYATRHWGRESSFCIL